MATTITQVRCPRCGATVQTPLQQVIDLAQDPTAKARLLSGRLNVIRCTSCGYEGQLASPLVYHDPEKELLLSYIPIELGLPQNDQERLIGGLINQVINRLPTEKRKGYLLRPQQALTMQGLVERILQEDGITKEVLEAQRDKIRLFEDLIRAPEDLLESLVTQHDAELDDQFFQLATMALGNVPEDKGRRGLAERVDRLFSLSSLGKHLQQQDAEVRAAVQSLQEAGNSLTREKLLDLFLGAPSSDRVSALAGLTRPALDYGFFQQLTERIEAAQPEEKERLGMLRQQLLDVTQRIDQAQQARVAQAAQLLKALLDAPDLEAALAETLPLVDELFLGVLEANLRAARERGDLAGGAKLQPISDRIQTLLREALPPGLQLAQRVLEIEDETQAEALITESAEAIDEEFLGALMAATHQLEERGDTEFAERLRNRHRVAVRTSMRARMKGGEGGAAPASRG